MKRTRRQASLASAALLSAVAMAVIALGVLAVPGEGQPPSTDTAEVALTFAPPGLCTVPLGQGWNLISICAKPASTSINNILAGVDFRFVMKWNDTTQAFDIFSPRAAVNPFTTLEVNSSYFILLNPTSAAFSVGFELNPNLNISLVKGWSTPSWPYEFDTNITRYFNESIHRYLMKWNQSNQEFLIFSPRAAIGTRPFDTINSTEGQFILSFVDNNLTYNRTALQLGP